MYKIALVCEGPADRAILEAVLDYHLDDYIPLAVQPPSSALGGHSGPFGGGWKGVRTWCQQEAPGGLNAILANVDLVIIQVDGDVFFDSEYSLGCGCPPASNVSDQVRGLVRTWLGTTAIPPRIVLCVPAMASETWALVALFPPNDVDPGLECRSDIKAMLRSLGKRLLPKLVVMQEGQLKNQAKGYRAVQSRITKGWPQVTKHCTQAARFQNEIDAVLSGIP